MSFSQSQNQNQSSAKASGSGRPHGASGGSGGGSSSSSSSQLRGIFHASEDPSYWRKATEPYPNRVPRFTDKKDAVAFMEAYCQRGSNPDEPHLQQSISTLTCWEQIEKYLIPKIEEYQGKWKSRGVSYDKVSTRNVYMKGDASSASASTAAATAAPAASEEQLSAHVRAREAAVKAFLKTTEAGWRKYCTDEGKAYYHSKQNKETVWKTPPEVKAYAREWDAANPTPTGDAAAAPAAAPAPEAASERAAAAAAVAAAAEIEAGGGGPAVHAYLMSRLNLPVHRHLTRHSTLNTLRYLFNHMRCGIYVMIRNNEVAIFCPFVNKHYRNNWSDVRTDMERGSVAAASSGSSSSGCGVGGGGDGSAAPAAASAPKEGIELEVESGRMKDYYSGKEHHYRHENILPDKSQWWANGNIICNEHEQPSRTPTNTVSGDKGSAEHKAEGEQSQYWGDHFLLQLKDMLCETCRLREIPDCDFFINKRDYPQLKVNDHRAYSATSGAGANSGSGSGTDVNNANAGTEQPKAAAASAVPTVPTVPPASAAASAVAAAAEGLVEDMPVEPYGFIFNCDDRDAKQDIPLSRELYRSYAPILSFYTSQRFADIPMPPSEDWESACGEIFPPSMHYTLDPMSAGGNKPAVGNPRDLFTAANLAKFECKWEDKENTAFFRGGATGGGTTIQSNQRLHIAQLGWDWNQTQTDDANTKKGGNSNSKAKPAKKGTAEAEAGASSPTSTTSTTSAAVVASMAKFPLLDAKITGWNLRDKKIASKKMTYVRKQNFPFEGDRKKNFVEIYKQSHYKYLLYIEGHCAACRYGFMMQLGSVILKVDSQCVADQMWYFPLLKPYYDHVPVKSDLSNLRKQIEWCINNDNKCKKIAENAKLMYKKYVGKTGVLDYLQSVFLEINQKTLFAPGWLPTFPTTVKTPPKCVHATGGVCCMPRCDDRCEHQLCGSCAVLMEKERGEKDALREQAGAVVDSKKTRKDLLKQRMKEKAEKATKAAAAAGGGGGAGAPAAKRQRTA